MVDFPAPGRPTRTRCFEVPGRRSQVTGRAPDKEVVGFPWDLGPGTWDLPSSNPLCHAGKIGFEIPTSLAKRVPPELLQPRVRHHEGHHRLGNDSHRGD